MHLADYDILSLRRENNEVEQDGMFLDRTMQEQIIEQVSSLLFSHSGLPMLTYIIRGKSQFQKLIAVDEATVMQELIDDRGQEIEKVVNLMHVPQICSLIDFPFKRFTKE